MKSIMMRKHKAFRFLYITLGVALAILAGCKDDTTGSHEYFVAKNGSDFNNGSPGSPFQTINKAAQVAMPGDIITVREGIYREWVKPPRGGVSENNRIIYQAAPGADVRIMGSEETKGWTKEEACWKIVLEDTYFGERNPFKTLTRHPEYVGVDESGDGWGWLKYGRWTHLGDVIINGEGLTERQSIKEVHANPLTWYVDESEGKTSIWANFGEADPNQEQVELTARGYAFFPEKSGLNYITVRGFSILNVASHWAPPTVYQPAAIGPNGGHHWIIEDNIIMYAKAAGISIGIPTEDFDAPNVGHHIIRNNVIMRCGQGAVTGQNWNSHTQIYGNHIEDINYRKEFGGWETAGIKHHNADSLVIRDNFIRGVYTLDPAQGAAHGIWNDFRNSNWQVYNNIVMETEGHGILVEANWEGPNLFANNILINGSIGMYSTRGDAWVHNLFVNCRLIWENQPWGDRPQIGNSRWMNNFFIGGGFDPGIVEDNSVYAHNVSLDDAAPSPVDQHAVMGSSPSEFELSAEEEGIKLKFDVDGGTLQHSYPRITEEVLDLPFSFDATVRNDFFNNSRKERVFPGPFTTLQPEENLFTVYKFNKLYYKALNLHQ